MKNKQSKKNRQKKINKQNKQILEYKKVNKSNKKQSTPKAHNGKRADNKKISNVNNVKSSNNSKKNNVVNRSNNKNNKITGKNLDNEYLPNFEKESYNKNNTKIKKVKKKAKKIKIIIITLITFFVILIILISLIMYLPFFKVKNINVSGNNLTNIEDIISFSNIILEKNILSSFFDFNKENIESIPYIKKANIKIINNNTIEIRVTERESIYYTYDKEFDLYYKLDVTGRILENFDSSNYRNNELIVYGITFDKEAQLGSYINEVDLNRLKNSEVIKNEILSNVKDVNISKLILENDLYKFKINDKLEVIFNKTDNIEYNVKFLNSMLPQIGITEGSIDFTKENPVFIRYN